MQSRRAGVRQHAREGLVTELVWDASRVGTATAASGATLSTGDGTDWTPEELLAAAAAACLMRSFLQTAEGAAFEVLGYVTAADVSEREDRIHLRVCIVVEGEDAAREACALCVASIAGSQIARLLGERLVVDVTARCLCGASDRGG
jgi:organic hydroperoxide reductase OsmC/OhrA